MDRHQYLVRGLKVLDLVVMVSCFTIAAVLAAPGVDVATIREFMALRISLGNFILFGAFAALWHVLFSAFGLYEDPLFSNSYRKAMDVVKAASIGTCAIVAVAVPFKISFIDARFLLIFWTSVSILSFCSRLVARGMMARYNSQEENRRKILIVGANARSLDLARQIETEQELGCRVIGFVDDTAKHAPNFEESGYHLVAAYKDLADYLGKTAAD